MKEKEKLYIYVRVSTAEQVIKDYSLPRQKDLGIMKAKELGFDYQIFEEAGESASQEDFGNRPRLLELLNLVKEKKAKHIFVFDQSRLSRNTITKAVIQESLRKNRVQLYTNSKAYDFNKIEDEMVFSFVASVETYESALRKSRFKLGAVTANKNGKFLKGIPPYGYKKDENGMLVINEDEKEIFLKIVDMYLNQGYGTNKIAKWLNDNNIPTKTSKILKRGYTLKEGVANRKIAIHKASNKWNPGTILGMLKHELYVGKRRFTTENSQYDYVKCDPIIDEETFSRIQTLRAANAITKKRENKYFYLLEGLLQCGNCNRSLHGRVKPNREEYTYRCNSKREGACKCISRGINMSRLNSIVWDAFASSKIYYKEIIGLLLTQRQDKGTLTRQMSELEETLRRLDSQEKEINLSIKELVKKSIDSRISSNTYEELMDEYSAKLTSVENQRAECLISISTLSIEIRLENEGKSIIKQGTDNILDALKQLTELAPPFETYDSQRKAKILLKKVIKNIVVEYLQETKTHKVEIEFNILGLKKEYFDNKPYKTEEPQKALKYLDGKRKKYIKSSNPQLILNNPPLNIQQHR